MKRILTSDSMLTALGVLTAAGLLLTLSPGTSAAKPAGDGANTDNAYDKLPEEIELVGTVRDFRERSEPNGHPDFERAPDGGFGHYVGLIAEQLDDDGKPVFVGNGQKVSAQWRDAEGRPIAPNLYDAFLGDQQGSASGSYNGGIQSASSYGQWFRDVPGVNYSEQLAITLRRQPGTNVFVFDDREDPTYADRGGFFPINDSCYGNSAGEDKNFHFTYELSTEFVYQPGSGQVFTFRGDDDVLVFINGRLVIDLGGVHSAVEQTVNLDRLDFLVPNDTNTLRFFFAERHRTQSNFRIETTLNLRTAELPTTFSLYD